MKLPRDLSGTELIKLLCKNHGYQWVNQEGSHVILQTETPRHHRIAINWPAGLTGFVLESADAVASSAWSPVAGVANNSVTVTIGNANKFYRLRKP